MPHTKQPKIQFSPEEFKHLVDSVTEDTRKATIESTKLAAAKSVEQLADRLEVAIANAEASLKIIVKDARRVIATLRSGSSNGG